MAFAECSRGRGVSDMGRDAAYDGAFDTVIGSQWKLISDEQRAAAASGGRRGRLEPEAPDAYAVHDTRRYQRGHADVFREVFNEAYKDSGHAPPVKGERLLVVDVGAGAATVAVALQEALGNARQRRIEYVAFDPNLMMRTLGERILDYVAKGFRSAKYVPTLDDLDPNDGHRVLFAFSYVAHQDAVTTDHLEQWASVIEEAVDAADRAVELIYTTAANLSGDKFPELCAMLKRAGITPKTKPVRVKVQRRYPSMDGSDGRVGWDWQDRNWQVQAEHWVLRS
ncbi:hypothetical protein [Candidatus Poriferisodalis sp.]|uniref:hypothetical protein n=1 Tax=Candidatus Poriferisodalis sp. TaxID=3101277 RepID=UPI003B02DA21